MARVFLGLCTKLGNKEENIGNAIQYIEELVGNVVSQSALYHTEPWGFESTNTFINAVVAVETSLTVRDVIDATKKIERLMGRTYKSVDRQYKDRIIDIDILFYNDLIINDEDLIIPHPLMHERLFVLQPLSEIAPDYVHPVFHKTIQELMTF